jgi:hypothetical protein
VSADARGLFAELGVRLPDGAGVNVPVRCFANAAAHKRGDRNASCSVNVATGAWKCHGCGARGGAYDAAVAVGLTPREAMELLLRHDLADDRREAGHERRPAFSERELRRYADDLAASPAALGRLEELRGWTPDVVRRLGLGLDGNRVVLPVRDGRGALVGVLRYAPNGATRNGAKLKAQAGSRRELFPAPETLEDDSGWLLLVEGEPDALAALSSGLAAVGVPGVESWQQAHAQRFAGRRVAVWLDADDPGRRAAKRIAADLAPVAAEVRLVDYGSHRDDGYDLSDLLRPATTPELREQARTFVIAVIARTPVVTAAGDVRQPSSAVDAESDSQGGLARNCATASASQDAVALSAVPPREQRDAGTASDPGAVPVFALPVREFITREREHREPILADADGRPVVGQLSLTLLGALGGQGKTTLAIDLFLHLAAGVDFPPFTVPRPVSILMIENEGPEDLFAEKLHARLEHFPHELKGRLDVCVHDWGGMSLANEEHCERLIREIDANGYDLVFGDPLDSLGIEGVGSPEDTRKFLELMKATGLNRTVGWWLNTHPRKEGTREALNEIAGAWGGKPDAVLLLTMLDDDRTRVRFPKLRWAKRGQRPNILLAFDPETEAFSYLGEESDGARDYLAEVLELLGDSAWRTAKQIAEKKSGGIGANEKTVADVLKEHPDVFESRTGEDAKAVGRSPLATVWRRKSIETRA